MSRYGNEALEHMQDCASQYASGVHQLITGVIWLETENAELKAKIQELAESAVDKFLEAKCRILEEENAALKAKMERLSSPVSDEEWSGDVEIEDIEAVDFKDDLQQRHRIAFNALIARRAGGE